MELTREEIVETQERMHRFLKLCKRLGLPPNVDEAIIELKRLMMLVQELKQYALELDSMN